MDILKSLGHPQEVYTLLKFKILGCSTIRSKLDYDSMRDSLKVCYKYFNETSRSFAVLIQALDSDLRDAGCMFYLVLRALDTVEDDMTIRLEAKISMLHDFHTYLYKPEWRYMESKDKHRQVLEDFPTDSMRDSLKVCYKYLNETSRSFAAVIQALDGELRHAVCIFYLVLRALDTVEDDMTISLEAKIPMLHDFHTYLYKPEWRYMESKEKDRQVLEDFPTISLEFRSLEKEYQVVISDICHKMGVGMAEFLEKKVESLQEWDKYCHYVAGLVGIGLSQLFSASEFEDPIVGQDTQLSNSMGLFLQKTNIIRDYLEDELEGREFWPREVWSRYAKKLSDLAKPENIDLAVHCMNELITNALHHVPDVLTYLSRLKNQSVFNFCAIPQVMAIATLAACYNNQQVFRGVVKIRKGQAVTLMMDATNIQAVKAMMYQYVEEIYQKVPSTDPSCSKTQKIIISIRTQSLPSGALVTRNHYSPIYLSCAMLLAALSWQYLTKVSQASEDFAQATEN